MTENDNKSLNNLFSNNKAWAQGIKEDDPDFFNRLSIQQKPDYLWIGCSDSRVAANTIVNLPPGEVFVHRNIANVVGAADLNCLSVIQYAVEVLKVKHVIVCGHYGCGGIAAAMDNEQHGLIDNWLKNVKTVYRLNKEAIDNVTDPQQQLDRLCEFNVVEQVYNVCNTNVVQNAWANGQQLTVHGWIYDIKDGILKDLEVSVAEAES
ncbi:carbonate dehydratase [Oceanicoccus sagamiensis]|uniref:Carbonic anhydrase n=1 Tax=Oceanicoccus sagamiensis TaxID=716816 RepID=A0A1X9NBU1_9GAMM|nr:carbonate dehydratase [Oceanicoccus sagamiensis]ARN74641.1 carbonate dehydratase [Oceanicoccus sagamiensis]